tara:strand:+ start:562 stop:690 length:129 start_codon:yes stop_codon:yes gene_type:complete
MRGGDVMVEAKRRKDKEERRGVEAVQAMRWAGGTMVVAERRG